MTSAWFKVAVAALVSGSFVGLVGLVVLGVICAVIQLGELHTGMLSVTPLRPVVQMLMRHSSVMLSFDSDP